MNLKDHSYKDATRMPMEDFESATTDIKSTIPSWANAQTHLWMFGTSDTNSLLKEQCALNRDAPEDAYIPEPFPKDEFEPIEWRGILDVCVNETTHIVFCNEEGYDVIPICMIKVNHENGAPDDAIQGQEVLESATINEEQEELDVAIQRLALQDEISIRYLSDDEDEEVKG